ncbi:MAG: hypothetical protein PUC36_07660 [Clostridiales bacterium]|nr:hypothetical protein [Clostridiales bacterium]
MKKLLALAAALSCLLSLAGCGGSPEPGTGGADSIPFQENQLYAAAYLGYQETGDLSFYTENYLDGGDLPVHHVSSGDYYLIIPRYEDMTVQLYQNDIQTGDPVLFYEEPACRPFLIQCNVSDIFPDVTIRLTRQGETAEFSPFLSLENGKPEFGDRGLDITR